MLRKRSYSLSGLENKTTLANIMLVANALVWYYTVLIILQDIMKKISLFDQMSPILFWCIHFSGLIVSAIIGASLSRKIEKTRLLVVWMTLSVVASLTLFALDTSSILIQGAIVLLLGVSLGLGMPTCMSYYSDCIPIEKRGRVGGITMLLSGIGIFGFAVAPIDNLLVLGIALAVWRLSSLVVFLWVKASIKVEFRNIPTSYKSILSQKSFLAYFAPWVMFSLVNYLVPLQPLQVGETADVVLLIQTVFMGIFAIVGGFFVDSIGRKRIAIAGFTMLGLSSAALGVSSTSLYSLYFASVLEGTAWGFLLVLFILTLWGDLSYSASSDKYYALGVTPFFASKLLELTIGDYIANNLSASALFPFTAFFLFLAVLPLAYAPETLPEKTIKDRELKNYIEKAQKEAAKAPKKENENALRENGNAEVEFEVNPEDYEKAAKEAEKYY